MESSIWTQPPVLAAIVTGAIALILALWNFFSGRSNQINIEKLKRRLDDEKSESDARRQYEFEARKKLYQEYEPLLFQLIEASEAALYRIRNLARAAHHGNLDEAGWLSQFNYYTKSTLYKLFVPVAIYQIMRKKLTLVDVTLDSSIGLRYNLAKQIYIAYTDDFEFARIFKSIEYNPNDVEWKEKRKVNQSCFWRQGLPMGLLDKTVDILIEKGEGGKERVISYGEFERKLENDEGDKKSDIHLSRDVFFNFHPQNRPVLWRMLIAQTFLLKALLSLKSEKLEDINEQKVKSLLFKYRQEDVAEFKWSANGNQFSEFEEPFKVSVEYFKERF